MRNYINLIDSKNLYILLKIGFFWVLLVSFASGDDSRDTKNHKYIQSTFNKVRIEAFFQFGGALDNIILGTVYNDKGDTKNAKISGGGGEGAGIAVGCIFSRFIELDASFFLKKTHLISTNITNATGSFTRTVITGTMKYVLPISKLGAFKFGVGVGYYIPGKLDLDLSRVTNGEHIICNYNSAIGIHIITEYEHLYRWKYFKSFVFGLNLGVKYYNVSYAINMAKVNNEKVTLIDSEFNNLNGSGIDMYASISIYIK